MDLATTTASQGFGMAVYRQVLAGNARACTGGDEQGHAGNVLRRDKGFKRGNLRHLSAHCVFAAAGFLGFGGDHAVYPFAAVID